ncbi:MAG TPA: chromate efflux transporter [Burkholderiales bacterium]|nr:chromate efflux transporter [Burkholderiales bacterium]
MSEKLSRPAPVSFREAFWYWLKLGFISFGGPTGQIAIMHTDLVERKRWISERRFLHALNYCMLLPGPEATQLAVYIGWLMHRTWGGVIAGALFVLPSLVLLIGLTWVYLVFGDVPTVAGFLYGIKPAITAIVLFAAWRIGSRALKSAWLWAIAVAAFIAIFVFDLPFPLIIVCAALFGFIGGRLKPGAFTIGGHAGTHKDYGPSLIGDGEQLPHTHYSAGKLACCVGVGLLLWSAPIALLFALPGVEVLRDMGWFFTKAAMLTFGGAYAVLPYVFDSAVEHYRWLSAPQMIDGLALGETTPGPLIMIVAFVGFVGAWTHEVFGPNVALAGIAGACIATYFTFLPSFIFILAGGPLVEATHGDLRFTAPLTGITAAVVGVIVNLAAFFAYHVFWPKGFAAPFEWFAVLLALAAFFALLRYKAGMIPVILLSGLAGLIFHLAI